MPDDDAPVELSWEELRVLAWRRREFTRLGFSRLEARVLAYSDADLALARKLRKAGCRLILARRILL